jgi:hypothetical protein
VLFQRVGREGLKKTFVYYQAGIPVSGNRELIQAAKSLANIQYIYIYIYPGVISAAALH